MRLVVLLFSILAFSSCARIAEVNEFRPVFLPAPGLAASFPSPAASFAKATKLEKKEPLLAGELYLGCLQDLAAQLSLSALRPILMRNALTITPLAASSP